MALTKLTTDLIDSTIVTSVNGSTGAVTLGTGTDWQATPKTADFTAVAGEGYFINTTSAAITVTLPSGPTAGDEVSIVDYTGTADTNNITITSNDNINGASDDVLINYERGGVSLVYVDATQGWIAYNANNETASALNTLSVQVDYLVVAGGGSSGAAGGGGGGGGGLRTSYGSTTGGGGSSESSLSLLTSTNYSVTVGAGGAGVVHANPGNPGSNSEFSTITSTGGGFGGSYNTGYGGGTGGSGGGAGNSAASTSTFGDVVSPIQGYVGGYKSVGSGAPNYVTAGGGGAGGPGGNVTQNTTPSDGGIGLAVNILNSTNAGIASVGEVSGSNVYYAGGGGGSSQTAGTTTGSGGLGGGTAGAAGCPGTAPLAGTPNTGGGNGGTGGCPSAYSTGGGSGVVILRYPSDYTITVGAGITEATGSPFVEGSDKVSVFTAGTGTIIFGTA